MAERLVGFEYRHASCLLLKADKQIEQAITTAEGGLRIAQTALNAFPLFELLLRVKEPSRLPAGIYFEVHTPRGTGVSSLRIRVRPLLDCPTPFKRVLISRTRRKALLLSSLTVSPNVQKKGHDVLLYLCISHPFTCMVTHVVHQPVPAIQAPTARPLRSHPQTPHLL